MADFFTEQLARIFIQQIKSQEARLEFVIHPLVFPKVILKKVPPEFFKLFKQSKNALAY